MFEVLESHFSRLDNAEVSPESIFKIEQDKERYETLLMFVFRKYEAASYHLGKTKGFINREKKSLEANNSFGDIQTSQVTFKPF